MARGMFVVVVTQGTALYEFIGPSVNVNYLGPHTSLLTGPNMLWRYLCGAEGVGTDKLMLSYLHY